jgi:hypothetical protein
MKLAGRRPLERRQGDESSTDVDPDGSSMKTWMQFVWLRTVVTGGMGRNCGAVLIASNYRMNLVAARKR